MLIGYLQANWAAAVQTAPILGLSDDSFSREWWKCQKHVLLILAMKLCMNSFFYFARWTIAKFPIFWGVWRQAGVILSALNWDMKIWKILQKNFFWNFWNFLFKMPWDFIKNMPNHIFFIFHYMHIKYCQMTWPEKRYFRTSWSSFLKTLPKKSWFFAHLTIHDIQNISKR